MNLSGYQVRHYLEREIEDDHVRVQVYVGCVLSAESKANLLTAAEIIPEILEMPSWTQHLLSEVIRITHISIQVVNKIINNGLMQFIS